MKPAYTPTRCRHCMYREPQIRPTGPHGARVMIIAEYPGELDIRFGGLPVQGDGGQELDGVYLHKAGLRRDDCYVTLAHKCLVDGGSRSPTESEVRDCANANLYQEIAACQPEIILSMGGQTAKLFDRKLTLDHGIAEMATINLPSSRAPWRGWVMATYSPNAGLSAGDSKGGGAVGEESGVSFMYRLVDDMAALKQLLATGTVPEDAYPDPDYRWVDTEAALWDYLDLCLREVPGQYTGLLDIGMDTESDMRFLRLNEAPPWCATLSAAPGTGILIPATATQVLRALNGDLMTLPRGERPRAIIHNLVHDQVPLAIMGVQVPRVLDTMEVAFNIGLPNKGLKYLTRRYLGMHMTDYEDTVWPWSMPVARDILQSFTTAYESQHTYTHQLKSGPRKGQAETRWRKDLGDDKRTYNKVVNLLDDLAGWIAAGIPEDAYGDVDPDGRPDDDTAGDVGLVGVAADGRTSTPWSRWAKWQKDAPGSTDIVEFMAGRRWEQPSIVNVPRDVAVKYACGDADGALRLLPILMRMIARIRQSTKHFG